MSYEVTNFTAEVLEKSDTTPVLCDFWANWCGPCKMLAPVLEKLAQEARGRWVLAKVDTDRHQQLTLEYRIQGIPALKLFHRRRVIAEITGAQPENTLRRWLEQHLPSPQSTALAEAERALAALRFAEAARILASIPPETEPQQRFLLAKAVLWSDPLQALSLLRQVPPGTVSEQALEAVQLLAAQVAAPDGESSGEDWQKIRGFLRRGEIALAMEKLASLLWEQPRAENGLALRLMRSLILYLGLRHPLSEAHYRAYSSAVH